MLQSGSKGWCFAEAMRREESLAGFLGSLRDRQDMGFPQGAGEIQFERSHKGRGALHVEKRVSKTQGV